MSQLTRLVSLATYVLYAFKTKLQPIRYETQGPHRKLHAAKFVLYENAYQQTHENIQTSAQMQSKLAASIPI